jgi:signal recognition particle receptor subunit beta
VRGEFISLATSEDRTLFFDFLPLDLGDVKGWNVKISLYTVPGQVQYNASRKLILNGADALVFVADSAPDRADANIEALQNMAENLQGFRRSLKDIPWVLQYNKRDLPDAMAVEDMQEQLNKLGVPDFLSVAKDGPGVFATLRAVSQLLFRQLSELVM